jgi:hypothetical protein
MCGEMKNASIILIMKLQGNYEPANEMWEIQNYRPNHLKIKRVWTTGSEIY